MNQHVKPQLKPHWSAADIARAASLWQRHIGDHYDGDAPGAVKRKVMALIASAIGRTVDAVDCRYRDCGPSFSNGRIEARGLPSGLASDRADRLVALRQRNLTASVFGDPAPGYSALDRRRGTAST